MISRVSPAPKLASYSLANFFLHSSQAKGFSAEWARLWRLRCSERVKTLLQTSHFMSCIPRSSLSPEYRGNVKIACVSVIGSCWDMAGKKKPTTTGRFNEV